jgi:nitrite reductase/ring-hydroxylating ferredoxin subunit
MHETKELAGGWHAVARSADAVPRHVLHAMLAGQELAIWRDDAGNVNAWENRCPHRGVRLSIGTNTGTELQCRYHGWRYESGSGQCRFIPAHPNQTPAKAVKARPFGCVEKYGFIWVNLAGGEGAVQLDTFDTLEQPGSTLLRSMFVDVAAGAAVEALARYQFAPQRGGPAVAASTRAISQFVLESSARSEGYSGTIVFMVQPVDEHTACIHGAVVSAVPEHEKLAVQLHHNRQLSLLRKQLENPIPA